MSQAELLIEKLREISATLDALKATGGYGNVLAPRCWACGALGPGLTALPDGRPVHRWPCRERVA